MSAPVELIKHVPLFNGLNDKQLKALAAETRNRGYELVARHAEEVMSSGTVVAENRSTR